MASLATKTQKHIRHPVDYWLFLLPLLLDARQLLVSCPSEERMVFVSTKLWRSARVRITAVWIGQAGFPAPVLPSECENTAQPLPLAPPLETG
ncbi:Cardiomyopathy-associated protein 5 [Manis javanica]|nr:Cardiomyopathy-associated protein 5 [Manis javanica]